MVISMNFRLILHLTYNLVLLYNFTEFVKLMKMLTFILTLIATKLFETLLHPFQEPSLY